jgi:predicted hydrolase (HD superfamily)
MTVSGRVEAAALLLSLDPPGWFLRHARAVAEVAAWLARRTAARSPIDRRLVEAAALLHDVDKAVPADDPVRALPHGEGSAAWLADRGHPELAGAVAAHPVTRLLDTAAAERLLGDAPLETLIVAYADKRAGQRLEPMDARFASWRRRYPDSWTPTEIARVREHADRLERLVCDAAGVRPGDVRRLAWTGPALRLAGGASEPGAPVGRLAS